MELYPAIDVRDGRCVRLRRGDFAAETVYDNHPASVARRFEAAGARWLHVVDLDAARTGEPENMRTLAAVCSAVQIPVQAGGGVRDETAAQRLLDAGAARVVAGTAAVESPALVERLCARHPGRIAVGLDARGRRLAVRGWTEGTDRDVVDLARRFAESGVAALVVTEIGRDGTMAGPDLDQLGAVLGATDIPVIASGGVGSLDDLRLLDGLEVDGRRLTGAIVGRAIYEGRVGVAEALRVLAGGD
ncbi:MAG: 1-(5-phosphoribosyl)-5-[(5-phosphoribosylamino)methylideneamino]imidazole-4-carboxamide isomerase [Actinobacteria bacterium]|nr:1-(5-phosphoribosyl)-5-[(5-phosphoribosylamino)methylideneamino]imidazole-4-carboxamide isomerase [Actinomycetota bacterium]